MKRFRFTNDRIDEPQAVAIRCWNDLVRFATTDWFQNFNRYLPWRSALGVLISAAVVAALCGHYVHPDAFAIGILLVSAIALGLAWPWIALRGISARMEFDSGRTVEGDSVGIRIEVRNRMPFVCWAICIRGALGRSDNGPDGYALAQRIDFLPPFGRRVVEWEFVPDCRGVYPLSPMLVSTGFPFGLWEARRKVLTTNRLLAWPRRNPVGPLPDAAGNGAAKAFESQFRPGYGGDVLGVRPYRRGDPLRRIHWGQTARHDRLIVCEQQSNAVPWIRILIDPGSFSPVDRGRDAAWEWAIRVFASFVESSLASGAVVDAGVGDRTFPLRRGGTELRNLFDELARLDVNDVDAGHSAAGAPTSALARMLIGGATSRFTGGLTVAIAPESAVERLPASVFHEANLKFVVLCDHGFGRRVAAPRTSPSLPMKPWIHLEAPDRVAEQLKARCRGAVHAR